MLNTAFRNWIKEKLAPLAVTIVVAFLIGLVFHIMGWDMGDTALILMLWQEVKEVWTDGKDDIHGKEKKQKKEETFQTE